MYTFNIHSRFYVNSTFVIFSVFIRNNYSMLLVLEHRWMVMTDINVLGFENRYFSLTVYQLVLNHNL